jgi:hypothetical protein
MAKRLCTDLAMIRFFLIQEEYETAGVIAYNLLLITAARPGKMGVQGLACPGESRDECETFFKTVDFQFQLIRAHKTYSLQNFELKALNYEYINLIYEGINPHY